MIPSKLLEQIIAKLGQSRNTIYRKIEALREKMGYTFKNKRIVAYVFALANGIDPSPFIETDELAEYREAIQIWRTVGQPPTPPTPAPTSKEKTGRKKTSRPSKPTLVQIPEMERLDVPNLPKATVNDAREMAKIYPLIYLYENSVREFIREVLDMRSPDWWDRVSNETKRKVEDRKRTETQNAYHGKTRVHPIQYVDFDDLGTIIGANAAIFNEYMPDKNVVYIQGKLRELKDSRNTLMHCNPLTDDDVRRVRLYLRDWMRQLKEMLGMLHKARAV